MVRDSNERSSAEADARLRAILQAAQLPMWVFEPQELRFVLVNDAALATYGYSRSEFLSMSVPEIRGGVDGIMVRRFIATQLRTDVSAGDWRHQGKDGLAIWADVRVFPVMYENRACFCAIPQPVNERRRIEAELAALRQEPESEWEPAGRRAIVIDGDLVAGNDAADGLRGLGLEVTIVDEAWAALDALKAAQGDLAVVTIDVTMAEGHELFYTIRERWPAVPIVISTALGPQVLTWMAWGSQTWTIRKPFSAGEFARMVRTAMRHTEWLIGDTRL